MADDQDWTRVAFDLLAQPLADGEVVERLVEAGCPEEVARKLVGFIPTACGRVVLSRLGVAFSDNYRGTYDDGSLGAPQRLRADPSWNAAAQFVAALNARDPVAVHDVGTRSAEYNAVEKAVADGGHPADLVCVELVLHFVAPAAHRPVPWWAFWRRT